MRSGAGRRLAARFVGALAAAALALPAVAGLVPKVQPSWSPFLRSALPPAERSLLAEARRLLVTDPGRVAEVLASAQVSPPAARIVSGLRADALYLLGGKRVLEAQKLYRGVITQNPPAEEEAWAEFMLGNTLAVQGYTREAEVAYRASLTGIRRRWRGAALFGLGSVLLDANRPAEARVVWEEWLGENDREPGKPLVLYLLAEALARAGDAPGAVRRASEAGALRSKAWLVRPRIGLALAEAHQASGDLPGAIRWLEAVADACPGAPEGLEARLTTAEIWKRSGRAALEVRSHAKLLDEGLPPDRAKAAQLRIAVLGAENGPALELPEHYPAYKTFFRPAPVLEEACRSSDPLVAQQALRGLGLLARREGRLRDALGYFARAFEGRAATPEGGSAYDAFVDCLEQYLSAKLKAGAHEHVVDMYDWASRYLSWVSARDLGTVKLCLAEACEALGAPRLARETYEELLRTGTRALSREELEARVLRTRAAAGDPSALAGLGGQAAGTWRGELAAARALAGLGRYPEAGDRYERAAAVAPEPSAKLGALCEANRLLEERGRLKEALAGLERRKAITGLLPAGAERRAWERDALLTEARLRFATGDAAAAAKTFARFPELSPDDTYVYALAERASGREEKARALFERLARGADAGYASLASLHLGVARIRDASGLP